MSRPNGTCRPSGEVLALWRQRLASGEATRAQMADAFSVGIPQTYRWIAGNRGPQKNPRKRGVRAKPKPAPQPVVVSRRQILQQREAEKRERLRAEIQRIMQ
jgi:hypothetical protein